jgi:hypothetical protein
MFDKAVHEMCKERFEAAKKTLEDHKDAFMRLTERLTQKENLELDELIEILGKKEGADIDALKDTVQDLKKTAPATPKPEEKPKEAAK